MEQLHEFFVTSAPHAHWIIFFLILLAGLNLPISLDALAITAAVLAAAFIPENTLILFLSLWVGAVISAWISYWFGRTVGSKLMERSWFQKMIRPEQLEKMKKFYDKHGLWAAIIGRFIPFGARNCLFMSSGMSRSSFAKFAIRDTFACLIWSGVAFSVFYSIGHNYEMIHSHLMTFNIVIFSLFAIVTGTILVIRKRTRALPSSNIEEEQK